MTNRTFEREENILYLMNELEQALDRHEPRWTTDQRGTVMRLTASLTNKLREMALKL